MTQCEKDSSGTPLFSIVIPVYDDWIPLERCLQALSRQVNAPSFEVVVVDDGSHEKTSETIFRAAYDFPLTAVRQAHSGIASARNHGVRKSKGSVLLFIDADCKVKEDCLGALAMSIAKSPEHDCFQLRIVGNSSSLVGRAEGLRLMTFQNMMLQEDARIRYLNTAGFAIRRSRLGATSEVFNPAALRAEDTLLLANLMQVGELPLFVSEAVVEHDIPLSLVDCLRKDFRSAYLERRAYEMIAAKGLRIRLTHRERLLLVWSMWEASGDASIGRSAWFAVVARQAFQRMISFAYRFLRLGNPGKV